MKKSRNEMRKKRTRRIRVKMQGTKARPRLVVYRSNTRLLVQMVDDEAHVTLLAARAEGKTIAAAKILGEELAKKALKKGIKTIVFDRSGYRYHGAIRQLADALREGGVHI